MGFLTEMVGQQRVPSEGSGSGASIAKAPRLAIARAARRPRAAVASNLRLLFIQGEGAPVGDRHKEVGAVIYIKTI